MRTPPRAQTRRVSLSLKRTPPTPQKRSSSTPPLSLRLKSGGLLLFFEGAQVKGVERSNGQREDVKKGRTQQKKRRRLFRVSKRGKKGEEDFSANFFLFLSTTFYALFERRRRRLSEDDVRRRRRRRTGGLSVGCSFFFSFSLFLFLSFCFLSVADLFVKESKMSP